MKLNVPFFKQTTPLNCGPMALRMAASYLGDDPGIEVLEKETGINEGKGIYTIQIAIASANIGYKSDFYSKHVSFNEENLNHEYYQKFSDMDLERSKILLEEAKKAGINIEEKSLSLEELLSKITENSVPIVLINWNVIKDKEGYYGHFVPLVGYDEENVYIHNHGLKDTQEFMPINKNLFDKARMAEGTDEDLVIVYKN